MQYCIKCSRAGDDVGDCGQRIVPCPRFQEVDPTRVVVMRCEPCDKTRAFKLSDVINGRSPLKEPCPCAPDKCQAKVVRVPAVKKDNGQ